MSSKTYWVLIHIFTLVIFIVIPGTYSVMYIPGRTLWKAKILKKGGWLYFEYIIFFEIDISRVPIHLNKKIIKSSLDRAFPIKNLKLHFFRCACLDGWNSGVMTNDRRLVNTWPGLLKVSLVTCFIELLATRVWDVHYPHQHRPLNQTGPHRMQCPGEKQVHSTCTVKHRYTSTCSLLLRVQCQICDTTLQLGCKPYGGIYSRNQGINKIDKWL